jgi:hypothetical protein
MTFLIWADKENKWNCPTLICANKSKDCISVRILTGLSCGGKFNFETNVRQDLPRMGQKAIVRIDRSI